MQQSERFGSYIREVCGQIRWKKARALAAEELEAHLEDQRDALLAEGVPAGPAVGQRLEALLNAVMDGKIPNERTALLKYLREERSWT